MIKCQDLQHDLPLYFDGNFNSAKSAAVDEHLTRCPLCRQKLSEYQELRVALRSSARPEPPHNVLNSVRAAMAAELWHISASPAFPLIEKRSNIIGRWLMPYAVGGLATLLIGFTLLWTMLSTNDSIAAIPVASPSNSADRALLLAPHELTPTEYANSRLAIAGESPSVNPQGALVALTRSLVRGEMKDDEVVVVADVFGNGLAQIAEVVEPSSDRYAVMELQKALQSDPEYAPFVPANVDQRSETIRVVLKIQNVNVHTRLGGTAQ